MTISYNNFISEYDSWHRQSYWKDFQFAYDNIDFSKLTKKEKEDVYAKLEKDFIACNYPNLAEIMVRLNPDKSVELISSLLNKNSKKSFAEEVYNGEISYYSYYALKAIVWIHTKTHTHKMIEEMKDIMLGDMIHAALNATQVLCNLAINNSEILSFLGKTANELETIKLAEVQDALVLGLLNQYLPKDHSKEDLHNLARKFINFPPKRKEILSSLSIHYSTE